MGTRKKTAYGLGVDIGGTFTDFALLDYGTGEIRVEKVLTGYADLSRSVFSGVDALLGARPEERERLQRFVHGTTLATNALIQRSGARTALVVTKGFRDVLELGRESRYDIYDIELEIPQPLIPRELVFEATERLDFKGNVIEPLDPSEIERLARELQAHDVQAVAVCFLHAFVNPQHERRTGELLRALLPGVSVSLSAEVMPDLREYERASTTAANAYVQPAMRSYLAQLVNGLTERSIAAPVSIMTSDGGTVSCDTAARFPVRLVESGPAGGAIASAYFGRALGLDHVIALDMGGTTAKICVIDHGEPERATEFEVGRVFRFAKGSGLPLKVPVLEMIEIGAGGGSIAHIDELGLLRVGPQSAASSPGPACYDLGGTHPTVTDADLYLGYLDADYFLGGRMSLSREKAERAIREGIAKPLKLGTTRAAWGIHQVVNNNMARAAKVHCLERGKDPREYVLIAYGGAGPVHAYQVAKELGMARIVFPLRAGVMSAFGFLVAPAAFELIRADVGALDALQVARVNRVLGEMENEGRDLVKSAGVASRDLTVDREVALRFAGQSFELLVDVPAGALKAQHLDVLRKAFWRLYENRYHKVNRSLPIEVVHWRVVVRGPRPRIQLSKHRSAEASPALKKRRPVFVPERNEFVSCAVYDRYALAPGQRIAGPAVVEEPESTAVIGAGANAEVDAQGNLLVSLPQKAVRGGVRASGRTTPV